MLTDDKTNILVVDDLPEKLLVLETVLAELGQNVIAARSGPEALRRVLELDFAVILLDVNMPDMDGFETAALIRKRKKSAHTPIIFITAFADEMHTAQGYSLGAVDYILSPVVPEVLRTKVKVFVELFRMTETVKRQADERVALAEEKGKRAAAEEAIRRTNFLAEAGKALASSFDLDATLRTLARLPVPFLADLAAVTFIAEPAPAWRTEMAWQPSVAGEIQTCSLESSAAPRDELRAAVERVLKSGGLEVLSDLAVPYPPTGCGTEAAGTLRRVVVLPLQARGRTLGALTLGRCLPEQSNDPGDLALADEFASRAAIHLDNAFLYATIQEADRRKNEFLSMLAHELRNPLAPIRNAVHILRLKGPVEPQFSTLRDMIDRQVQQLVRLVDDLLDISRITRGKIRLQTETVDLTTVVQRAVETSRPLLDARRHELSMTLPQEPLRVLADPVRLAQVVGNLLNNAAKYTEEGGQVWVAAGREGDEAVIRVRDTGVGIPTDMLSSIFDLFTQVDRSLDRSQGGLGIGLTLVRRLVEMHQGQIQVFSEGPGRGSEFVVRLPALEAEGTRRSASNGVLSKSEPAARCRVLVVDDNQDAAESLAVLLRLGGHELRVCSDGPQALVAAAEFRPEVVLLDIGLPGMDGYEVARELRRMPGLADAVVVAVTGYGQEEDLRRAREAGFDHHLIKPADPETLTALFASFVPA